jgi:hypothetical protein
MKVLLMLSGVASVGKKRRKKSRMIGLHAAVAIGIFDLLS